MNWFFLEVSLEGRLELMFFLEVRRDRFLGSVFFRDVRREVGLRSLFFLEASLEVVLRVWVLGGVFLILEGLSLLGRSFDF